MGCEYSSTKRVNKLLVHPTLVDVSYVQTEINIFSILPSVQCSLIKLKDLLIQAWASALAETSRILGRLSSLVTVEFPPFTNYSISNNWIYTLFSFPYSVVPSIRILKKFDFETTSATFKTLTYHLSIPLYTLYIYSLIHYIPYYTLINSWKPSLLTYKDPITFLKFKIPILVTRCTKFGNFLNDVSFLATKYGMFDFLLSLLNSSSDTPVSTSFWTTLAGIFKIDALNERKIFIWSLPLQWSFIEANIPPLYTSIQVFFNLLMLFISPSNFVQALHFKVNFFFHFLSFSFSSHSEISRPDFHVPIFQ